MLSGIPSPCGALLLEHHSLIDVKTRARGGRENALCSGNASTKVGLTLVLL
jgi:hypothetical protein